MRITSRLVVPPALAVKARARWQELGGSPSTIRRGNDAVQVTFLAEDRDTPDGKLLATLAGELGATSTGPVLFSQAAVYNQADIDKAELVLLEVGALDDAIDLASLTPAGECPGCGLPLDREPVDGRARLRGSELAGFDFFSSELLLFVRESLAAELRRYRGVRLSETSAPAEAGTFYWLSSMSTLGYPTNGVTWGSPCAVCGQRRGTSKQPYVTGLDVYPRSAWDGSDALISAVYPTGLIVTQPVWKLVSNPRWRVPEGGGVGAHPVHLVETDETPK
jgi:hypothetical protein